MNHPFLDIPRRRQPRLFLVFFILTVLTMIALNLSGRPPVTLEAPFGIVSYEFAGDVPTATAIIDSWDEVARIAAGFNLGLDYLFLLLYSASIAMALLWLTGGLALPWITSLAIVLAWGQWLAAALDAVENLALLTMLFQNPMEPWPQVAWWCAAVKFALVIVGLIMVLVLLFLQAVKRLRGLG